MVGITNEEKECKGCMGSNARMCDGPRYMGGMCTCDCHVNGDKIYRNENGRIVER